MASKQSWVLVVGDGDELSVSCATGDAGFKKLKSLAKQLVESGEAGAETVGIYVVMTQGELSPAQVLDLRTRRKWERATLKADPST